jgi:uncharacterized membrane protein
VVIFIDKGIYQLAKHWLALANLVLALYVGLPLLAPIFMEAGWTLPAKIIYTAYRPACHQRPDRSYFFGGPQATYTPKELAAAGVDGGPLSRDIGSASLGWKVAFCERDVAIYGSMLLAGLAYGLIRRRRSTRLMPLRVYALFVLPMAVDGILQLFGVYESTWLLRTITGVIFGVGSVLFAFPYLEEGFADVRRTLNAKLHLEDEAGA